MGTARVDAAGAEGAARRVECAAGAVRVGLRGAAGSSGPRRQPRSGRCAGPQEDTELGEASGEVQLD